MIMMANSKKWLNITSSIALIIFISLLSSYLFSASVDLAHHYLLVDNLSKYWHVNNAFGNLGEMAIYPNLSHWIAVAVGSIFGSNIVGLTIVTCCSIVALWMVLFLLIFELPRIVSYLSVSIILFFGLFTHFYNVFFGFEVIDNFFYSQIVAQSLAFLSIYCFYIFEKNNKKLYGIIFLFFAALIIAFAHILPAMQLMVFAFIVILLDFWTKKKINFNYLLLMISSAILLLLHPSFAAMKKISQNDGALGFGFPTDTFTISFITILTIIVSLFLIFKKKSLIGTQSLKLIAIFALSSSLLLLLQILAVQFGYGSNYAVKKHMFSVFTLFIIELSILGSYAIYFKFNRFKLYDQQAVAPKYFFAVLSTIFLLSIQIGIGHNIKFHISDLKTLESKLISLHTKIVTEKDAHKIIYIDKNPLLSYLFSVSILEYPRNLASLALLSGKNIFSNVSDNIITSVVVKTDYFNNFHNEPNMSTNDFKVYNFSDLRKSMKFVQEDIAKNIYSTNGLKISEASFILTKGWNDVESEGAWSKDHISTIEIKDINMSEKFNLSFVANSWLVDRNVTVNVNGMTCGNFQVLKNVDKKYIVSCNKMNLNNNNMVVEFIVSDYNKSPKSLNISEDRRTLGIYLSSIRIYEKKHKN